MPDQTDCSKLPDVWGLPACTFAENAFQTAPATAPAPAVLPMMLTTPKPAAKGGSWWWLLLAAGAAYVVTKEDAGLNGIEEDAGDDAPVELNGPRRRVTTRKAHKAPPRHVKSLTIS